MASPILTYNVLKQKNMKKYFVKFSQGFPQYFLKIVFFL